MLPSYLLEARSLLARTKLYSSLEEAEEFSPYPPVDLETYLCFNKCTKLITRLIKYPGVTIIGTSVQFTAGAI